jgi:hypothetical protein
MQTLHLATALFFSFFVLQNVQAISRRRDHHWRSKMGLILLTLSTTISAIFYIRLGYFGSESWWINPRGRSVLLWRYLVWIWSAPFVVFTISRLCGRYAGRFSTRWALLATFLCILAGFGATVLPMWPLGAPALAVSFLMWAHVTRVIWDMGEFAATAAVSSSDQRNLGSVKITSLALWVVFPAAWVMLEVGFPAVLCEFLSCFADVFAKGVLSSYFCSAEQLDTSSFMLLNPPGSGSGELAEFFSSGERLVNMMVRETSGATTVSTVVDHAFKMAAVPEAAPGEATVRAIDYLPSQSILAAEEGMDASEGDQSSAPEPQLASLPLVVEMCVDEVGLLASKMNITVHFSCNPHLSGATSALFDLVLLRSAMSGALLCFIRNAGAREIWVRAELVPEEPAHLDRLSISIEGDGGSSAAALRMPSASESSGPLGGFAAAQRLARLLGGDAGLEVTPGLKASFHLTGIPVERTEDGLHPPRDHPAALETTPVFLVDPDPARPEVREYIVRCLADNGLVVVAERDAAQAMVYAYGKSFGAWRSSDPLVCINTPRELGWAPVPVTSAQIRLVADRVKASVSETLTDSTSSAETSTRSNSFRSMLLRRPIGEMRVLEVILTSDEVSLTRALVFQGVLRKGNTQKVFTLEDAARSLTAEGALTDIVYLRCEDKRESEKAAKTLRAIAARAAVRYTPMFVGIHIKRADPPAPRPAPGAPGPSVLVKEPSLDRIACEPVRPSFLRENLTHAALRWDLAATEMGQKMDEALNVGLRLLSQDSTNSSPSPHQDDSDGDSAGSPPRDPSANAGDGDAFAGPPAKSSPALRRSSSAGLQQDDSHKKAQVKYAPRMPKIIEEDDNEA